MLNRDAGVTTTSPTRATSSFYHSYAFLPDFTEHPKPKRQKTVQPVVEQPVVSADDEEGEGDVTFFQDLVAGGMAGCASVIVGHPLDTMKVRVQNSAPSASLLASIQEFGGASSLFRGMGAPLSAAAVVNAVVFSSYGVGSKLYDMYIVDPCTYADLEQSHDPWQKSMSCGALAGLVQCVIICPMEHVKCRLQVQHGKGSADNLYKGPVSATRGIVRDHGLARLYQGWVATVSREIPAFALYFAVYDHMKDVVNRLLVQKAGSDYIVETDSMHHTHTWIASALAGGIAGSTTWGVVYPVDVIKTKIQTAPLDTPMSQLSMWKVGSAIVAKNGWRHLFRGLGITLVRAFPVNGTIFPVYEFTLIQLNKFAT